MYLVCLLQIIVSNVFEPALPMEDAGIIVPSYVHVGGKAKFMAKLIEDKAVLGESRRILSNADIEAAVDELDVEFSGLQNKAIDCEEKCLASSNEYIEGEMRDASSRTHGWIMWLRPGETLLGDIQPKVFMPCEGYTPSAGQGDEGDGDSEEDAGDDNPSSIVPKELPVVQEARSVDVDSTLVEGGLIADEVHANKVSTKRRKSPLQHVSTMRNISIAGAKEIAAVVGRLLKRVKDGTIRVEQINPSYVYDSATILQGLMLVNFILSTSIYTYIIDFTYFSLIHRGV
jgi:hypothetical protein